MTGPLTITLCSPDTPEVEISAEELILPGAGGVFTVQADHTPLLTTLIPGVVEICITEGNSTFYAINGGFVEIKDNTVKVLAEMLEAGDDIKLTRAEEARTRAEKRLVKVTDDLDVKRAEFALQRAIARIDAQSKKSY